MDFISEGFTISSIIVFIFHVSFSRLLGISVSFLFVNVVALLIRISYVNFFSRIFPVHDVFFYGISVYDDLTNSLWLSRLGRVSKIL